MEQDPAVSIFDPTYFSAHTKIEQPIEGSIGPSYSAKSFEKLLNEKFGDLLLNDIVSNVDVLVSAYNITEKKEVYFTNDPNQNSYKISDVIRASTAVPTYFPAKKIGYNYYVDGGIFMNNPAFKAYLEAKRRFPQAEEFVVCSLGTGFFQLELNGLIDSGWIRWMSPLISLMMNESSELANGYLKSLGTENYCRLQYNLPEEIPMDDIKKKTLRKLAGFASEITKGTEFENLVEKIVMRLKDQ